MTDLCKPCLDRGRETPATRQVEGEPWCENCFSPDQVAGLRQEKEARLARSRLRGLTFKSRTDKELAQALFAGKLEEKCFP